MRYSRFFSASLAFLFAINPTVAQAENGNRIRSIRLDEGRSYVDRNGRYLTTVSSQAAFIYLLSEYRGPKPVKSQVPDPSVIPFSLIGGGDSEEQRTRCVSTSAVSGNLVIFELAGGELLQKKEFALKRKLVPIQFLSDSKLILCKSTGKALEHDSVVVFDSELGQARTVHQKLGAYSTVFACEGNYYLHFPYQSLSGSRLQVLSANQSKRTGQALIVDKVFPGIGGVAEPGRPFQDSSFTFNTSETIVYAAAFDVRSNTGIATGLQGKLGPVIFAWAEETLLDLERLPKLLHCHSLQSVDAGRYVVVNSYQDDPKRQMTRVEYWEAGKDGLRLDDQLSLRIGVLSCGIDPQSGLVAIVADDGRLYLINQPNEGKGKQASLRAEDASPGQDASPGSD